MSANFNNAANWNSANSNMNKSANWVGTQPQTTYTTTNVAVTPVVEQVLLPTQVIEKPVAIHEEIRKEMIEEVQPVWNVEKLKTEIHQVTQPLFDKETRAVTIENRTLNTEVLPEVLVQGRGTRAADDFSTVKMLDTQTVVVEKPAIFNEVEKRQIIEEVQPVIYKETIVPMVIQETKPVYQKIVEGPVITQETLASKSIRSQEEMSREAQMNAYVPSTVAPASTRQSQMLPTQVVEKPVAVHEEIRRETIEEIQPVVNVEKIKTEVHQITAPLFDKEVKPVITERRVLAQEVLPEVIVEGRGLRAVEDRSTTAYLDTKTTIVEKPAIYNEVERTQVIEEIQPVLYKETVVPTVIRETKPVFQKIVEGAVYTQQTLPARSLVGSGYQYPTTMAAPIVVPETIPVVTRNVPVFVEETPRAIIVETPIVSAPIVAPVVAPIVQQPLHRKEVIEEITTTTTTTTVAPVMAPAVSGGAPAKQHHGLFHRHAKDTTTPHASQTAYNNTSANVLPRTHLPGEHVVESHHTERVAPNGQKIIEDVTTTTAHSSKILPTRAL